MSRDPAICPHCKESLTEYDEGEGFISFHSSVIASGDKLEGHIGCPACGDAIYIAGTLTEIERG